MNVGIYFELSKIVRKVDRTQVNMLKVERKVDDKNSFVRRYRVWVLV